MANQLVANRKQAFGKLDRRIRKSFEVIESESLQLSRDLLEMARDREDGSPLWTEGEWPTFKAYLEDIAISAPYYRSLITSGRTVELIESEDRKNGCACASPTNANQIRPLATITNNDPESVPAVWEYAVNLALEEDESQPEKRHVEVAVQEYNAKGGNIASTRRKYSDREKELKAWCEDGYAVVANINSDSALISWAESKGKYVYVGRGSKWGNPFKLPEDGDRDKVCECYAKYYFPHKPSLKSDLESLEGMVLGCYCSPQRCHADRLAELTNQEGS